MMRSHVARLYALAIALVVFFAVWLAVAAHPWAATAPAAKAPDPRIARLQARERHLRAETRRVNLIVHHSYAVYRRALARRNRANAAARAQYASRLVAARSAAASAVRVISAPSSSAPPVAPPAVSVVTLPPVAATRTS